MRIVVMVIITLFVGTFAKHADFEKEMSRLAQDVTANVKMPETTRESLVIVPLNDKRAPGFAELVEDYLMIPLVQQGKLSVVDRSQLAAMIQEAELMNMADQPVKIGKIASANYMLTGTVSSGFDKNYMITLRLISVETSQVVGAASVEIPCSELEKRVRRN